MKLTQRKSIKLLCPSYNLWVKSSRWSFTSRNRATSCSVTCIRNNLFIITCRSESKSFTCSSSSLRHIHPFSSIMPSIFSSTKRKVACNSIHSLLSFSSLFITSLLFNAAKINHHCAGPWHRRDARPCVSTLGNQYCSLLCENYKMKKCTNLVQNFQQTLSLRLKPNTTSLSSVPNLLVTAQLFDFRQRGTGAVKHFLHHDLADDVVNLAAGEVELRG